MRKPTQSTDAKADVAPKNSAGREAGYLPEDRVDYWKEPVRRTAPQDVEQSADLDAADAQPQTGEAL